MTENALCNLFVYGSLRSGFNSPEYAYISQYFHLLGTAKVQGILYDLGDYPAAIPTTTQKYIIGEVYSIKNETEFNWAIGQVDDYEGVNALSGERPQYRRDSCVAELNDGTKTHTWIYWYNGDVAGKPVIPAGDVIEYFRQKNK